MKEFLNIPSKKANRRGQQHRRPFKMFAFLQAACLAACFPEKGNVAEVQLPASTMPGVISNQQLSERPAPPPSAAPGAVSKPQPTSPSISGEAAKITFKLNKMHF